MSILTSHLTHHHISSVESVISHRNHCRHVPTSHSGCHIEVIVQVVGANCLIWRRRSPRNIPAKPIWNPASPWPVCRVSFKLTDPARRHWSRITYMYKEKMLPDHRNIKLDCNGEKCSDPSMTWKAWEKPEDGPLGQRGGSLPSHPAHDATGFGQYNNRQAQKQAAAGHTCLPARWWHRCPAPHVHLDIRESLPFLSLMIHSFLFHFPECLMVIVDLSPGLHCRLPEYLTREWDNSDPQTITVMTRQGIPCSRLKHVAWLYHRS